MKLTEQQQIRLHFYQARYINMSIWTYRPNKEIG